MLKNRYKYSFTLQGTQVHKTSNEKSNPPHKIKVVKGSAYGIFSKDFVDFLLNDQRAKDFLNWTRDILSPDEYFWATMNHNPDLHAPGSYNGTLLNFLKVSSYFSTIMTPKECYTCSVIRTNAVYKYHWS